MKLKNELKNLNKNHTKFDIKKNWKFLKLIIIANISSIFGYVGIYNLNFDKKNNITSYLHE